MKERAAQGEARTLKRADEASGGISEASGAFKLATLRGKVTLATSVISPPHADPGPSTTALLHHAEGNKTHAPITDMMQIYSTFGEIGIRSAALLRRCCWCAGGDGGDALFRRHPAAARIIFPRRTGDGLEKPWPMSANCPLERAPLPSIRKTAAILAPNSMGPVKDVRTGKRR